MMRLWRESYARPRGAAPSAVLSVALHVTLVGGAVIATLPDPGLDENSLANRVFYMPPPKRPPAVAATQETLRFIELSTPGPGEGAGPASFRPEETFAARPTSPQPGDSGTAPVTAPATAAAPGEDSVFTEIEVDSAVTRAENSAAPAYPLELITKGIQGSVLVRYVVDTTGFADPASLEILSATHPAFAQSVKDAVPYMRFHPARMRGKKVRQMVEQPFIFRIQASTTQQANATRPPSA